MESYDPNDDFEPMCPLCGSSRCGCTAGICLSNSRKTITLGQPRKMEDATQEELTKLLTDYLGDEVFAKRFAACMTMIRAKNADYSQGEQKGDRIAAFRRISKDIGVSMEKVWAIFCQKHWGAVMKYVKDGILESESIDGRINDIINYCVLLGAIIDDKVPAPYEAKITI